MKKESYVGNTNVNNYSINPNMNSNINPMTMIESSKVYQTNVNNAMSGNNGNEINTNLSQQDQPKPWVIG